MAFCLLKWDREAARVAIIVTLKATKSTTFLYLSLELGQSHISVRRNGFRMCFDLFILWDSNVFPSQALPTQSFTSPFKRAH